LYLFCDAGRTPAKIAEIAGQSRHAALPDKATLRRLLDSWVQERIMARLDGRYVSLALRACSS